MQNVELPSHSLSMRDAARERARRVVLVAQAATILSTWPLWSVRALPPNLPLIDLPLPCHAPLFLSLALAWRWPARGALLHALVLALAILLDTTRLTAAPTSLAVLLLTLSLDQSDKGARSYLAALWAWAGLNKLLSPAFMGAPALALALPSWLPLRDQAAIAIALVEVALGMLAMIPSMHRTVRIAAPLLHVGALLSLTLAHLNRGVWPWNAALAMCAWWLFQERAARPLNQRDAGVALLFFALPALYYVGPLPPAFAHHLYSDATPTTLTCRASGCTNDRAMHEGLHAFGVPVPPSATTLRAYFLATCSPGDRWLARSHLRGVHYDEVIDQAECPAR